MINRLKHFGLLTCLGACVMAAPSFVHAEKAGLMISPTRFVLGESERTVTVDIINKGDARGSYRIELIDMIMPENGSIRELKEGETDSYSLKRFARISPRRTVLKPDGVQKIRILLRRPKDLEDGEYRSHLKVTLTEDNLDRVERAQPTKNLSIQIKPRLAFTIPIIVRQGETHYQVNIDEAKVYFSEQDKARKTPMLEMLFRHKGTRSSMGDIKVHHIKPDGNRTVVVFHPGVAVYRTADSRRIRVPLNVPEGVNLNEGKLHITYVEKVHEGGDLITEKTVNL